jgi:uncharacterized membrane protein YfcA
MDGWGLVALLGAGVGAGIVNAVAGGGSLITFPTLLALGLNPVAANVTNSIAVTPGYLASVYGSRHDLDTSTAKRVVVTAALGSISGSALLLVTPARAFELVVPYLVLLAAGVLAFSDRLRALVGHPHERSPRTRATALHGTVFVGAVYGGYFGAALGVMLVAALGLVLDDPLRRVNALKNAVSAVAGVTTVIVFAVFGPVDCAKALLLAPASLIGGYVGARLARRLPSRVLRVVIVTVGLIVGIVLLLDSAR